MPRVSVATFDKSPRRRGFRSEDEFPDPEVETNLVFDGQQAPIHLRVHHVPPGKQIEWRSSRAGHLVFVWSGSLVTSGRDLHRGGILLVEHRAHASVCATREGCSVVVFNPSDASNIDARHAGGKVHILPPERVPRVERLRANSGVGGALFADARCPTCGFWLHENSFHDEGFVVEPHYHSEDEIIVVTSGQIRLGGRSLGPGTAIAVSRNTVYGFRVGSPNLTFINFRPKRPSYALAGATDTVDELTFYPELESPLKFDLGR